MIPKIIHYCWLSDDPIPNELEHYMASWKKKLPDYEFILWNFNRFDKNSSVWVNTTLCSVYDGRNLPRYGRGSFEVFR